MRGKFGVREMVDNSTSARFDVSMWDEPSVSSGADGQPRGGGVESGDHSDELVASVRELTGAIRDLVARSPVSSEEFLTAEQLAELFRMSPRTLRDLAASGHIPHHRIGKLRGWHNAEVSW
jgi:excisionase family DNA binding protein